MKFQLRVRLARHHLGHTVRRLLPPPDLGGDDANRGFILFTSDRANSARPVCARLRRHLRHVAGWLEFDAPHIQGADAVVGRSLQQHQRRLVAQQADCVPDQSRRLSEIFLMNADGATSNLS